MKRISLFLLTLFFALSISAQGLTYESGKFVYKLSGNSAIIVGPADESITDARIPSSVKIEGVKYPVTGIADGAFYNIESLLSVSLGINIRNVGDGAFFGCSRLKAVYCYAIEPPVCSGKVAVFGCENGTGSVSIPDGLTVYVSAGSLGNYRSATVWNELPVEPMVTKF